MSYLLFGLDSTERFSIYLINGLTVLLIYQGELDTFNFNSFYILSVRVRQCEGKIYQLFLNNFNSFKKIRIIQLAKVNKIMLEIWKFSKTAEFQKQKATE